MSIFETDAPVLFTHTDRDGTTLIVERSLSENYAVYVYTRYASGEESAGLFLTHTAAHNLAVVLGVTAEA